MKRLIKTFNFKINEQVSFYKNLANSVLKKRNLVLCRINIYLDAISLEEFLISSRNYYLQIEKLFSVRRILINIVPIKSCEKDSLLVEYEYLESQKDISVNTYLSHNKLLQIQEIDSSFYQERTTCLNPVYFHDINCKTIQKILEITLQNHLDSGDRTIIRLWNFIGNITDVNYNESGMTEQNYQAFNNARYFSFSKFDLKSFPASTGIGMDFMKLLTICTSVPEKYNGKVYYLSNKLQKEAYKYDENVLVGNTLKNFPPLFSRGLIFETFENYQIYVSGTSSIIGQESVNSDDLFSSTNSTINNIREVCNASEISTVLKKNILPEQINYKFARIYIKNKFAHDAILVKEIIDNKFPNIAASYVIADICREELPIEIELYAEIEKNND